MGDCAIVTDVDAHAIQGSAYGDGGTDQTGHEVRLGVQAQVAEAATHHRLDVLGGRGVARGGSLHPRRGWLPVA